MLFCGQNGRLRVTCKGFSTNTLCHLERPLCHTLMINAGELTQAGNGRDLSVHARLGIPDFRCRLRCLRHSEMSSGVAPLTPRPSPNGRPQVRVAALQEVECLPNLSRHPWDFESLKILDLVIIRPNNVGVSDSKSNNPTASRKDNAMCD